MMKQQRLAGFSRIILGAGIVFAAFFLSACIIITDGNFNYPMPEEMLGNVSNLRVSEEASSDNRYFATVSWSGASNAVKYNMYTGVSNKASEMELICKDVVTTSWKVEKLPYVERKNSYVGKENYAYVGVVPVSKNGTEGTMSTVKVSCPVILYPPEIGVDACSSGKIPYTIYKNATAYDFYQIGRFVSPLQETYDYKGLADKEFKVLTRQTSHGLFYDSNTENLGNYYYFVRGYFGSFYTDSNFASSRVEKKYRSL